MSDPVKLVDQRDAWNFRAGECVVIPDPWNDGKKPRSGLLVVEHVDRVNGVVTMRRATRWEWLVRFTLTPLRWLLRRRLS